MDDHRDTLGEQFSLLLKKGTSLTEAEAVKLALTKLNAIGE